MAKSKRTILYTIFSTEWGYFGLAGSKKGLLRTHLPCDDAELVESNLLAGIPAARYDEFYLHGLQEQIIAYFKGYYVEFSRRIPIVFDDMSPFARDVLRAVRKIPYGRTVTYGQLALALRRPQAARAVGLALARNRVPLVIPCHRVIRSDGKIGGFSGYGSTEMKQKLIKLEQSLAVTQAAKD